MMRSVLCLTECGPTIGFGHVVRCGAIAKALEARGTRVDFWIHGDSADLQMTTGWRTGPWLQDLAAVVSACSDYDAVLIDSFQVGLPFIQELGLHAKALFIIDDFPRRAYETGVVIDWTAGADAKGYPHPRSGVDYLLGPRWCPLRPAFQHPVRKAVAPQPRRVLVSLGGSDVRRLSPAVAETVLAALPAAMVDLVLGPGAPPELGDRLRHGGPRLTLHSSCGEQEMCRLMDGADLAVCGGGQTAYELAARGVPPVFISLIDNQDEDIQGFTGLGFGLKAGAWAEPDLLTRVATLLIRMSEPPVRMAMAEAGQTLVDGQGAARLSARILGYEP